MKILIVDDEQMMLQEMKDILAEVKPKAEITLSDNYKDALKAANERIYDIAFLDIEMPEMSGIQLAKKLKEKFNHINIIFVTAYTEYAVDAFSIYASGYLLKPVQKKDVENAFDHLRTPVVSKKKLQIRCFGNFEVYSNGKPIVFGRSRSKEILAYLIDLKGASANTDEICAALWETAEDVAANKHYFRNLVADLKRTLRKYNAENVFINNRNQFYIDPSQLDCDY